jgi:DNA modification methylase
MTVRILLGDCRDVLKTLPDASVHCCVTSPPYWGLRSYLPDDHPNKCLEIGSEPTLQEWVQTMVEVFREVRRVLRDDGTLWLNLGDAYAGSGRGGNVGNDSSGLAGRQTDHARIARSAHQVSDHQRTHCPTVRGSRLPAGFHAGIVDAGQSGRAWTAPPAGLKPKDMMGQPWRVAFALQDDGWWLRQEIIWAKPNPMPESARDRCTKAHEHIFLLSKSERYFYDFDAMQEPVSGGAHARNSAEAQGRKRPGFGHGYDAQPKPRYATPDGWATGPGPHTAAAHQVEAAHPKARRPGVGPKAAGAAEGDGGYADGKSERLGRGPGWRARQNESFSAAVTDLVDTRNPRSVWTIPTHAFKGAHFATFPPALAERCITAGCPVGGLVLDPFGGAGTVGLAADRQHKSAVLIDLDERNLPMASDRIKGDAPLFSEVTA